MLTRRRFIQAGLTVALGSILTGYGGYRLSASLQGTREALAALRASRTPLALLEGYREFRGVIHAHTRLSHDSHGTPAEILSAASDAKSAKDAQPQPPRELLTLELFNVSRRGIDRREFEYQPGDQEVQDLTQHYVQRYSETKLR